MCVGQKFLCSFWCNNEKRTRPVVLYIYFSVLNSFCKVGGGLSVIKIYIEKSPSRFARDKYFKNTSVRFIRMVFHLLINT